MRLLKNMQEVGPLLLLLTQNNRLYFSIAASAIVFLFGDMTMKYVLSALSIDSTFL